MNEPIAPNEWNFNEFKDSPNIDLVNAVRDWEVSREAWKENPESFDWFIELRKEAKETCVDLLQIFQEKYDLRAGLWTISPEFPELPVLELDSIERDRRISRLLPIVPLSRAMPELVKQGMGENLEKLKRMVLETDNVRYDSKADIFVLDNRFVTPGNRHLIFPVDLDLKMSKKAIVESFRLLLESKLELLGLEAGAEKSEGQGSLIRQLRTDLKQLSAYRLRKVFSENSNGDWWLDALEIADGLYSRKSPAPWNRAADAGQDLVRGRANEIREMNPDEFVRREVAKLIKKAKEIGVDYDDLEKLLPDSGR